MIIAKRKKFTSPPRVRHEPPTIDEAIAAAQGLTADAEMQVEIAAGLMGVSEAEVRPAVLKLKSGRLPIRVVPTGGQRSFVVERRSLRSGTGR